MNRKSIIIAAFAAFALAFAMLWQGAAPIAEAQQIESPVEVTKVVPGDGRLQVNWTYSGDESEVTGWAVFWRAASGSNKGLLFNETRSLDATDRSFIIDHGYADNPLDNGVEHTIRVAAKLKDDEWTETSDPVIATPLARAAPVVTVVPGKNRLTVNWTYEGAEIGLNRWAITWIPTSMVGGTTGVDLRQTGNGASRSFAIERFRLHGDLRNGTEYTVWVRPWFGNEGGLETEATGVPNAPLPDVKPEITSAEPYDSLAEIDWTFDAEYGDDFADLEGWKVCHRRADLNALSCDYTDDPSARIHLINGLDNGKTYAIIVRPVFEGGREGNPNDDYQVELPKLTLPGAPENMRLEIKGSRYILHWDAPENDGGTPIFWYLWQGGSQKQLAEVTNTTYSLNITGYMDNDDGVDRSQFYTFHVRAENSQGRGPVASYTIRPYFFPPVIDSQVGRLEYNREVNTIRWSEVEGAVKYRYNLRDVTSGSGWNGWRDVAADELLEADDPFECYWRGVNPHSPNAQADCSSSLIGEGNTGMHLELTPGNTYRIMVRAKTSEGIGPQSAKLKFVAGGRALQPQDLWARHHTMEVEAGGEIYIKNYVKLDWTKEYTGGPHDEGEYWQVRHNLSGNEGDWSRWITLAWITNGKGPLSGALPIRQTYHWTGDKYYIGTHLAFPEGSESGDFLVGASKFQVRRGHVDLPALSVVSEVELKSEWRSTR